MQICEEMRWHVSSTSVFCPALPRCKSVKICDQTRRAMTHLITIPLSALPSRVLLFKTTVRYMFPVSGDQ